MFQKLNSAVQMCKEPVYGSINSKQPVMALSIDKTKKSENYVGIIREIQSRKGDPSRPNFLDLSKLIIVESKNGLSWKKKKYLKIEGIDKIVKSLDQKNTFFLGLEDPDIYSDKKGTKHLFFTIPFKYKRKVGYTRYKTHLGHAQGPSLEKLKATKPVLTAPIEKILGFKEVAISPESNLALSESRVIENKDRRQALALSSFKSLGSSWKYEKIALDPLKLKHKWCNAELSPCCFLPPNKIKLGKYLVGIINAREKQKIVHGKVTYGPFRVGLILFDPITGEIPWISKKPLLEDPKAKNITFASDFLQINKNYGYLYAHVDDSFIRAYKIDYEKLKNFLPENIS